MNIKKASIAAFLALSAVSAGVFVQPGLALSPVTLPAQAAPSGIAKSIGTIKSIEGTTIVLAPASGPEISVTVQPNARLLRLAPGEKDLKNAAAVQFQDLHVGDTIRARGAGSADGKSIAALEIVVITSSALAAVSDQMRQDWQKRGMGGLVSAVDLASSTVNLSVTGMSGKKTIAVHVSKTTIIRRYSPDSMKFEDATPSSLADIQPNDQLRARGNRSPDGTEFTADEIVTGRFRNVAGTVNSVDASSGTFTVQDVLSKKSVQIKVTQDSQLHQLPPDIARIVAMRLKAQIAGSMPAGAPGAGPSASAAPSAQPAPGAAGASNNPAGGMPQGMRSGGAPDFQSMLNRMPAVALTDLHKGDAVMVVATQGSSSNPSTAITLLTGVEPILTAAPNASQAMMLTPWSLGGAPGGDAGNQ